MFEAECAAILRQNPHMGFREHVFAVYANGYDDETLLDRVQECLKRARLMPDERERRNLIMTAMFGGMYYLRRSARQAA